MFLVGCPRPVRTAPPVKPSAQPFFPPPRSTDGARIKQSGTNLAPAAASKPSTNARPTEMPMKQREPGEPGRPNGCQDCPSPKHRLLWTVPKDIVRLCEPQPGQPHLGQAGPEGQVPLRMAQKRHSPGPQARTGPGPGALGPESRFLPQITPIRRKGDGRRRITGSPGFSGPPERR